jgi:hypothetical protein
MRHYWLVMAMIFFSQYGKKQLDALKNLQTEYPCAQQV